MMALLMGEGYFVAITCYADSYNSKVEKGGGSLNIDEKMLQANNRPSGFDYLRLILACVIVVFHSIEVCYGVEFREKYTVDFRPLIAAILPMFFALSGFLVAGSLQRNPKISRFLYLRSIRIFPALCVEVLLSALLIGVIFTNYNLQDYFTDDNFFRYFGNIVGVMSYNLPGVFLGNPSPNMVNGQLWTIPYEFWCYIILAFIAGLRMERKRYWLAFLAVCYFIVLAEFELATHVRSAVVEGYSLTLAFLTGVVAYQWRKLIAYSHKCFIIALITAWVLLSFPELDVFAMIPVTYATLYLGVKNPSKHWLIASGDYSYGIFLYGFTIQQALASQPIFRDYFLHAALSLLLSFMFAYCSWHMVEKRVLRFK